MPRIEVGGAILELPDGAPPEAIKKAIEHFRTTPEFDRLVDKERGAPARVRMLVGSATSPEDRLANLKRFYPDAVPYGDENFVFSDPESGRPTLYNPAGLDLGDVASVGREASQFVGGGFGAVMGSVGGPVGTAVGAGAGAAAGGATFDAVMNLTQGRVDTRGPLGVLIDTAVDFGLNAAGQRFGEMLGYGLKRLIGGAKPTAQQLVERFQRLGVDRPPAGAASGSRTVGMMETMLRNTPGGAGVMQQQTERVLGQIKTAADDLAAQFGPVRSTQGAGQTMVQAMASAAERFSERQSILFDEAFDLIGDATPVPVDSAVTLLATMRRELARAPKSLGQKLNPAINQLEQLIDDAAGGGIEFGALRQVRTTLGREIDEPLLMQGGSVLQQGKRRVYGALTEDLVAAARATGPEAAAKLQHADRFTRLWHQNADDLMKKFDRFDADEKAFVFAMHASRDGGSALSRMRGFFKPEEWDVVAGSVLGRLGKATPGAQDATGEVFSPATFMTNWSRLAPEAKAALFSGKRYAHLAPKLDALVEAVSSLKGMEALANTSNTGAVLIQHGFLMSVIASISALASGNVQVAAGLFGQAAGAYGAAKLLTSEVFLDWLLRPVTTPGAVSAHIGRLAAIAEAEPAFREEIYQFVEALRSPPNTGSSEVSP